MNFYIKPKNQMLFSLVDVQYFDFILLIKCEFQIIFVGLPWL